MAAITTGQQPVTTEPRQISWHHVWIILVAAFWVAIVIGIIGGFFLHWTWTGFPENGKLWDWLQLLSAPVFVTALPLVFRGQRNQADNKAAEQPSQADAIPTDKIEENSQQEAALEAYQNYILQLLLDRNLRGSQPESDVREAARARTLSILRRVDKNRKGDVVQFLYDAGLIFAGRAIVELRGADLRNADLSEANLSAAKLSGVDMSEVIFNRTVLTNADLSGANLSGVDLSAANLTGANLKGAIRT